LLFCTSLGLATLCEVLANVGVVIVEAAATAAWLPVFSATVSVGAVKVSSDMLFLLLVLLLIEGGGVDAVVVIVDTVVVVRIAPVATAPVTTLGCVCTADWPASEAVYKPSTAAQAPLLANVGLQANRKGGDVAAASPDIRGDVDSAVGEGVRPCGFGVVDKDD